MKTVVTLVVLLDEGQPGSVLVAPVDVSSSKWLKENEALTKQAVNEVRNLFLNEFLTPGLVSALATMLQEALKTRWSFYKAPTQFRVFDQPTYVKSLKEHPP